MTASMQADLAALAYLVSGVLFILALRGLSSPVTSRTGNRNGMIGMALAIATTLWVTHVTDALTWGMIVVAIAIGGGIGAVIARRIAMTAMPQLVAAFHSLVGLAAVLVAAGGLSSCAGGPASEMSDSAATGQSSRTVATGNTLNQPVPRITDTTKLVDQDGQSLTLQSLRGKTVVVAPMLTYCQETCPMTSANMHQAAGDAQAAGLGGKVVFLEVTVDPDRDSVKRLHAYAKLYGPMPNWKLATGKPAAVKAFWKDIGVVTEKAPTDEPVHDWMTGKQVLHNYDVHHQDVVVIIDPAGHMRWITIGRPDARGTRLPTTMQHFLNEEGKHNLEHPAAGGASFWTAHDLDQAVHYVLQKSAAG